MFTKRTDLATESRALYRASRGREPQGIDVREYERHGVSITDITVQDSRGEAAIGKPRGRYLTAALEADWPLEPRRVTDAARALAGLLGPLLPPRGTVMVAGLGNRGITPDNLGPSVVEGVVVTRHLIEALPQAMEGVRPVCALSPGVLGLTGIETAEIIRGVCHRVAPAAIIAVDALAAMDVERLCRTFQLSDTGIVPGSGAGNARHTLNRQTLGVPVIAIGVPTVIDSATLVLDTLERAGVDRPRALPQPESMLVTPKDIDALIGRSARVIAQAINMTLHPDMSPEEMAQFLA